MSVGILFQVDTPLGFRVRTTRRYRDRIASSKHHDMLGRESGVVEALREPDEVQRSSNDPNVLLFYRMERPGRWFCVLAKRLDGEGFLITAYPADAIKTGERLWGK